MVTLIRLKKINNIISAEYFPEDDKKDVGKIVYDIEKKKIVKFEYCKRDKKSYLKSYLKKSVKAIEECVEKDDFQETVVYMWY